MIEFLQRSKAEKRRILEYVARINGLPPQAIEKDLWVCYLLRVLFSTPHKKELLFKGGTSLSKAYHLIERFSEDIDLAINPKAIGFERIETKGHIRKLRKACHQFVVDDLLQQIKAQLVQTGLEPEFCIAKVPNLQISDQDPETIEVQYKSVFASNTYLKNIVLVEISARSLLCPRIDLLIKSFLDEVLPESPYYKGAFSINTAKAEKTFLEKLILLHEEFQKPVDKIRYWRMSRHYYDLGKMIDQEIGLSAIKDKQLFQQIIEHRQLYTPVRGTEYKNMDINHLDIYPPSLFLSKYQKDYREMTVNMIYGKTDSFPRVLSKITNLLKKEL